MLDREPPRRNRVICVAYSCAPGRGSEPGIGWNRVVQAGRFLDTWALVRQDPYEEAIRAWESANGPVPGVTFHFVPETRAEKLMRKVFALEYVAYGLWQRRAYRVARQLHARYPFDVAHQMTWTSWREPGHLWKLGIPFVWGPLGGTEQFPWRFLWNAGWDCLLTEGFRALLNSVQLRTNLRTRQAARVAASVFAANKVVERDLTRALKVPVRAMLDVGTQEPKQRVERDPARTGPIRLVSSGVLEHRKGLHLMLHALAGLPAEIDYEFRILGDGPVRPRWERLSRRLGISGRCKWMGKLPLSEVMTHYVWADAFLFPSLRDTSGTVVLEALVHGLPVICLDHNGARELVTDECGIRIPVTTPAEVIAGLRQAVLDLASDRARLVRLSEAAPARGREFLWPRQGERMASAYEEALQVEALGHSALIAGTQN